jgi:hypothetical protein
MMDRSDNSYDFVCVVCNQVFTKLPSGVREISRALNGRVTVYEFLDGSQHHLKRKRKQAAIAVKEKI